MSIKRMTAVWESSQHKGSSLLLLLALADNADDEGYCWPGIEYLADKIRMTSQSVLNITRRLEESGELYAEHNRRHGNRYLVTPGLSAEQVEKALTRKFGYTGEYLKAITQNLLCKMGLGSEPKQALVENPNLVLEEPSYNRHSTVNDGADAPQPAETDDDDLFWGDAPRPTPSEGPTFTARDLQTPEGRAKAQAALVQKRTGVLDERPWLHLEAESSTIASYAPGVGVDRDKVLRFVDYMLENHVPLDLQKAGTVRFWLKEIESLLRLAKGDVRALEQSLQKAFRDGMSVKSPKSIEYAVSDIVRALATQGEGLGNVSGSPGGMRTKIHKIAVQRPPNA